MGVAPLHKKIFSMRGSTVSKYKAGGLPSGVELMRCHVHEGLWRHFTVLSKLVQVQLEPKFVDTKETSKCRISMLVSLGLQ